MEEKKLEEQELEKVNGAGEAIYGNGNTGSGAVWIGGANNGLSQPDIDGGSPVIDEVMLDK